MSNPSNIFETPIREEIFNFKTGEVCHLVSNEKIEYFTNKDYDKIAKICNQPTVYDFLFKERLNGKKYQTKNAIKFVNWMIAGWQNQKWFVFLVRNTKNEIIGAIDIKSDNLESAEIGCWADENSPGIMTNVTLKLLDLASKSGFKELFAIIKPNNIRSQNVVTRSSFVCDGKISKDKEILLRYHRELN